MASRNAALYVSSSIGILLSADLMPYSLSQLIGSTLALEYMRAEYVAPLGSTSLVFNFLFARFLVGTPVTSTDIYVYLSAANLHTSF
ncbi:hypothetical protein CPB84DRAFT_1781403 [Gymnopilus junonius]|uniref:Uncharacterized protein n=1 Tax=Gymnopilus junonius TaxID=109634 RepID=A0A9P5TMH6_GYMJU|nr:hypothetical protein CPB84DRAFT_1781403 [Gymnopilus junonius]